LFSCSCPLPSCFLSSLSFLSLFLCCVLDVPDYQKKLIIDLMDGNIQDLTKYSQDLLANPEIAEDAFELARQNLLSNPDLAMSTGIPMEAVNDPILWKDFMKNSLDSFSSLLENRNIDFMKEGGVGGGEEEDGGDGDSDGEGGVNPFDSLNNVFNEVLQTMHKHDNQQQEESQSQKQQHKQPPQRRAKKASSSSRAA
jgi:hypothetical protein